MMKYIKRNFRHALVRQIKIGRTSFVLRSNVKAWRPGKVTLNLMVTFGDRDIVITTHDQHVVQ